MTTETKFVINFTSVSGALFFFFNRSLEFACWVKDYWILKLLLLFVYCLIVWKTSRNFQKSWDHRLKLLTYFMTFLTHDLLQNKDILSNLFYDADCLRWC